MPSLSLYTNGSEEARSADSLPEPKNEHEETAHPERIRDLMTRCEEVLRAVGYPRHRSTVEEEVIKLQTIANRAGLENWEVRLLFGMLKQVIYRLENPA